MDNFKIIYKILKTLEKAMDYTDFDFECIGHERLGITKERWNAYIEMLTDDGYISGAAVKKYIDGETLIDTRSMKITLRGLEYLEDNSLMKKVCRVSKGVIDVIKP